jgi:hypothetical protein
MMLRGYGSKHRMVTPYRSSPSEALASLGEAGKNDRKVVLS